MAFMKSRRKGSISEDDVSLILQRYPATTVVTLLQEVSQVASCAPKIDWKKLVIRTTTGITCAREYQMLWRHLAYRDKLLEKIEENAEPLDDDSDLEFEVEAVPKPNEECLLEAKACVKIILNPTCADPSSNHNNNTANENMPRVPFDKQQPARTSRGTYNNFQSTDQKPNQQSIMGSSVDATDIAGSAPPKKKRKQWSKEEDADLTALVQKYGEKWEILKDNFKYDRTPHQLSTRWVSIKKRQGQTGQGTVAKSPVTVVMETNKALLDAVGAFSGPFLSGANNVRLVAQNNTGSVPSSMVSDARPTSTLINPSSNPNQTLKSLPAVIPKSAKPAPKKQATMGPLLPQAQPQPQSQPQLIGSVGPSARPISAASPNSIQAAAFAAGGRIATPSTARSLLEAAKSKNVVHIRSSVSLSNKPIAHTTINLSIRPSSLTLQTLNPNQNLNSSPGSGVAQVLTHPKKVKSVAANGDEVEMEVTEADGKKDASKLNGDNKTTINKENLAGEEKNDVTGCLIGVEKINGGVVLSNVKAVPEINKKENQTLVQTESKEKTGL
ncbi:uncharacterized protein LOC144566345 [Carex rostrata]